MLFRPDLFSVSRPEWVEVDPAIAPLLDEVLQRLLNVCDPLTAAPQQSGALGINSKNFRLSTSEDDFVLKRWAGRPGYVDHNIGRTLAIMDWLAFRGFPVPAPVKLSQDEFILRTDLGAWSVFHFAEGEYFSGIDDELFSAAEISGYLMEELAKIPSSCLPLRGPSHFSGADRDLLGRANHNSNKWDEFFGEEDANYLASSWPLLVTEWGKVNLNQCLGGHIQAAHFDLHPHNLIAQKSAIAAVLDFEACKVIPVGFALGFAGLKQCRQAMTVMDSSTDPRRVGEDYAKTLSVRYPEARKIIPHFGDLAVAETLRRIFLILRLNLDSGEKKWNQILRVQIAHLREARALFG